MTVFRYILLLKQAVCNIPERIALIDAFQPIGYNERDK